MDGTPHLSVTQIKTYLRCPLQYFLSYTCGIGVPPGSELVLGRSVHSALAHNYRQKIGSRRDLPLSEVADVFSDDWDREAPGARFRDGQRPGDMKDDGVKLLGAYLREVAPAIQPVDVERGFTVETGTTGRLLKGYIDLIDDQGRIIDHKTSSRAMGAGSAARDIQLTAYAMAYRKIHGRPESAVRLDVMVRNKEPRIQQLESRRTEAEIDRFLRLAESIERAIDSGNFFPNQGYVCGMCGYGEMCGEW